MLEKITCRLPATTMNLLKNISTDQFGSRGQSKLVSLLLTSYTLEIKLVARTGNEPVEEEKVDRNKKMVGFCLSEEAKLNLMSLSNQTKLSQAQVIEFMVYLVEEQYQKNSVTEDEMV